MGRTLAYDYGNQVIANPVRNVDADGNEIQLVPAEELEVLQEDIVVVEGNRLGRTDLIIGIIGLGLHLGLIYLIVKLTIAAVRTTKY